MLAALIRLSLTQRVLMLVLTAMLSFAGVQAFQQLPIDAFPDVSSTQVKIIMKAPGMTPEEVEARITAPIEVEMLGLPRQTMLRSVAKYALTDITIDFAEGTDIYWARQQVNERLSAVLPNLPPDVSGGVAPMTTPLGEMFMFTVEAPHLSLAERRSLLDWVIRPQLRTVQGVADVNSLGGLVRSFEIIPDNSRMYARGVTLDALQNALIENNNNDGAGRLNDGEESLLVRAEGRLKTLEDVQNTVIRTEDGIPVRVADVAAIQLGALTRYGAVTSNAREEVVEGLVLGLRGANARQVVSGIKAKLAEMQPTLPKGVSIHVFYDRSSLVDRAVYTVSKALVEAIVLVLVLLLLFLGNLRAALTVALILPLAALSTFLLMQEFGLSANLMSLGGLSIAIGMLVDAAVVVVENIASHLADNKRGAGLPRLHLIYRAVREVSVPVAAGVLIIITVFLPLLTLEGLEGKLFRPVAMTIVFALSASLLLSLTVIPVLASFLLRKMPHEEPWVVRKALALYEPALRWALAHGRALVIAAFVALGLTAVVYLQIGKIFMPTLDEGDIIVGVEKLPSINLQQSLTTDMNVQRAILQNVPEVKEIYSRTGADELGLDPMGLNQTDNFLILKPQSEWRQPDKAALINDLRKVMEELPGLAYSFTQPIDMRVNEMILGVRGDLAIKIFGNDLDVLDQKAQQLVHILQGIPGSQDVYTPQNSGVQYMRIAIDRLAAGRMGFNMTEIESILRAQLEGKVLSVVQEGQRRTPLLVRGGESLRQSAADFGNLMLTLPNGRNIPLSAVARLERVEGPVKIDRQRGARMVIVTSNVRDRDLVGFVEEAKARVQKEVQLPEGYSMTWGGQFENQQRAAARLAIVVPAAIAMIFLILFATFHSVRQATLILCNIPFAMIGGVFALWLSGEYLSVPASVGFIALLGIAVLNGVVMMSYFNQLHAQGLPMLEVVTEGAKRRLRPVLMTACIAAFGLLPLLFATGPGSEIQRPLAIVVIGGLFTSTVLTLILLPMLYQRFAHAK
ncbi:efflux RND transporter permease subunit [Methylovorus glucosotrophus]|uniref:Heavy metal efflux pump, CzcA family n=1 Tax=Methylovorus glucosotrophus (strain SIP3-4) TaxID=582744 RepID=C6X7I2_METGS|nr:CusA/CzcA family heavy metal efflux RND transporter [Methylovorus glucosotrophus]ACT51447.1 heavy metal efflux pump, CzcA family [Methylovorus glucosotrophus SIP3-4]